MRISDWSSDVCSSDLRLAEHRCCDLCFLVALRGLFCESGNALFEAFEVGQQQFGLDRLGIGDGIDLVLDMLDVVILETAQDMDDRIAFADDAEEFVAAHFALHPPSPEAVEATNTPLPRHAFSSPPAAGHP